MEEEEEEEEVEAPAFHRLEAPAFHRHLAHFLHSPRGAKYRPMFRFQGELVCGQPAPQVGPGGRVCGAAPVPPPVSPATCSPAPQVLVSAVEFQFRGFPSAKEWVPAMDRVYQVSGLTCEPLLAQVVEEAGILARDGAQGVLHVSPFYANWSADKVRSPEPGALGFTRAQVIQKELYQNLGTAILAIFVTVLLFLARCQQITQPPPSPVYGGRASSSSV